MSLDDILNLGDDQISAQYEIIFTRIPGASIDPKLITMRADQSFSPPARVTGTYDVWYQGQKIVKTSVIEETEKTFDLAIRLNQTWDVFDAMNKWYKLTYDEENATASNDAEGRTSMIIHALGSKKQVMRTITYHGVKIKSIKVSDFNMQEGTPMRLECGFIYLRTSFE